MDGPLVISEGMKVASELTCAGDFGFPFFCKLAVRFWILYRGHKCIAAAGNAL